MKIEGNPGNDRPAVVRKLMYGLPNKWPRWPLEVIRQPGINLWAFLKGRIETKLNRLREDITRTE